MLAYVKVLIKRTLCLFAIDRGGGRVTSRSRSPSWGGDGVGAEQEEEQDEDAAARSLQAATSPRTESEEAEEEEVAGAESSPRLTSSPCHLPREHPLLGCSAATTRTAGLQAAAGLKEEGEDWDEAAEGEEEDRKDGKAAAAAAAAAAQRACTGGGASFRARPETGRRVSGPFEWSAWATATPGESPGARRPHPPQGPWWTSPTRHRGAGPVGRRPQTSPAC